ncbi:MAG: hypothetical protein ACLTDR_11135 [Adlercreutzia equolifaciens]
MEVIRAKRAGACYGVQRALDMADEVIADGGRAYTLGPLIPQPAGGGRSGRSRRRGRRFRGGDPLGRCRSCGCACRRSRPD